ncbi:glycosyltransferase family protein [Neoaquamicrobium sediminum]|uniref:glycosyltransferase family protein n=1 Tax=Neoaquamicrobium sediminum TaxID=1849104 RepID=UPI001565A169|nr:glycosyltransferase [Mesorhizobium sediminum]NRC53943.1 glycosyltransferase [Mesorhizobium sediminum]
MSPPQVIVASAHPYMPEMRLGTSYLAEALANRGWDVLYLDQPTSLLHLVHPRSSGIARRKLRSAAETARGREQVFATPAGGSVRLLSVAAWWPHVNVPVFRNAFILDRWWRHTYPSITRYVAASGFSDARALLFDSPYFHSLGGALGVPTVYRYADRIQCFPEVTPALVEKQQEVFRDAALVVHTSKALLDDLGGREGKTLYLPNGVDIDRFYGSWDEPEELRGIAGPRIIYAGTIGPWFDWTALLAAAQASPDLQFVLLGKVTTDLPQALPGNVHLLGAVPFARIPSFLANCQAGIIPFDVSAMPELVNAINPLKLYEYCAAGLPVVSYASAEIEAAAGHVRLYRTPGEFAEGVKAVLAEETAPAREARRAWADGTSWRRRGEELERAILAL